MKLTKFRIENYRSIQDSGWVELDDIAVIVGKNESGKTSLLKALWKLNPFHDVGYEIDREFPAGRRKEKSGDKVVVTAHFALSSEETDILATLHESAKGITEVAVQRNYDGGYIYNFLPSSPAVDHDVKWVVSVIRESLSEIDSPCSDHFKQQYRQALDRYIAEVEAGEGSKTAVAKAANFKSQLPSFVQQAYDHQRAQEQQQRIDEAVKEIQATPWRRVVDGLQKRLPVFVYMDDYRIFSGAAQLDEVLTRKQRNQTKSEDETIMLIMETAGLNLEDEVKKGNEENRRQRMMDMNDASDTLTRQMANRWSQKVYEVMFQADGQHFETFVRDEGQTALVPLEDRSKGFQWFFSFDMTFMYETKGSFANAVILLDEPGLHLHAAAQRDLLKRMSAYAEKNQLIYSTHLPFMIDFTHLDNIFVCEDKGAEGTKVHKDWATADKDARFTLQAALGLSWSQSLFVGQFNLVVEGVTDYWFLTTISTLLKDAGGMGLDEHLVVTPAGGASKVAYVGTILHGQQLNVAVLLDSDKEGDDAFKQLVHSWILKDKLVLRVGQILGGSGNRALEDLFDEYYYLAQTQSAYTKELAGKRLTLATRPALSVVERVEEAMKLIGIPDFNKGRVAKRIMEDLARKKISDLPSATVENFKKVIAATNALIVGWRK